MIIDATALAGEGVIDGQTTERRRGITEPRTTITSIRSRDHLTSLDSHRVQSTMDRPGSTLRTIRYRRFSQTWGRDPEFKDGLLVAASDSRPSIEVSIAPEEDEEE
jgi:hypothetical protein